MLKKFNIILLNINYNFMPKVDKEKCVACGTCVAMCPDCFKIGDDGKAECSCGDDCKCDCNIDDVISSCPVGAISK